MVNLKFLEQRGVGSSTRSALMYKCFRTFEDKIFQVSKIPCVLEH